MAFLQTAFLRRSAVAFFNMKHFQVQQKIKIQPSNIHDVFSKYLRPDDRLLRQSKAGGGSTRILVLNKRQMVKAVYLPVLCVPHPTIVGGEKAVLGLQVSEYLEAVKRAQDEQQTTFAALSHPKGIAFNVYDISGAAQMPRMTSLTYSDVEADQGIAKGIGKHAYMTTGTPSRARAQEFLKAYQEHHELVSSCTTYFFINRERGSCLMLGDMRRLQKEQEDPDEVMITGLEDKEEPLDPNLLAAFPEASRWITLPEQVLQSLPQTPLYAKGYPTEDGLQSAVSSGVLLLDFRLKSDSSAPE